MMKDMKYFFVLGTNPALSIAELMAVYKLERPLLIGADLLVADLTAEINPEKAIQYLGGIIKIGLIVQEISSSSSQQVLLETITSLAAKKQQASSAGKFNFGFSDYGVKTFDKKNLGLQLKKYFSGRGISSRFVVSQEKTLSSVVVTQNKLLRRGSEIILAEAEGKIFIGETIAVQPFKDLSRRDYGRPARDDQSGMLPPKLAQTMINLAQAENKDGLLLDPFCGSGTILTEAMLMEYKNIFGSDISVKAIDDTKKNISWIKELYRLEGIKMKFLAKDVVDLLMFVKPGSVAAIVTEPYLGPQRGRIEFEAVIKELENLYSRALKNFSAVLETGGRAVMVWPVFYGDRPINPDIGDLKRIDILPAEFKSQPVLQKFLTTRGTIMYGRAGQKVFREVIVLEK